jgi:hypothetical protein
MVLGIASTALPFAQNREEAAERWLRILRLHGRAGAVLQGLGVSERPMRTAATPAGAPGPTQPADTQGVAESSAAGREAPADPVVQVTDRALALAREHGDAGVTTVEVLLAAIDFYGADFERVLQAHGTDRDEVVARLGESET